ncbi:hypothetical protein D3C80_1076910 [compost metagenome]
MIDIDDGQGQALAVSFSLVAEARQLFVEGLAVGQVGQGVGHGLAPDLLQMLAQADDFAVGGLQPLFQSRGMALDLAGGGGQGADDGRQIGRPLGLLHPG